MTGLIRENRLRIAWFAALLGALAVLLAQFVDYAGFEIGSAGVESANEVAPRPIELTTSAGSDQLWLGLVLALAALAALRGAWRGHWRLGRALMAIGTLTGALSIAILLPNGTDGSAGADYPDVAAIYADSSAKLLGGFWLQLAGATALAGGGAAMARWAPARSRDSARRRRGRPA